MALLLTKKLGIGERIACLNAPESVVETIRAEIPYIRIVSNIGEDESFIIAFFMDFTEMNTMMDELVDALAKDGKLWICWMKKVKGKEQRLSEDRVRTVGLTHGLVDVKIAAIDTSWSGLEFVYRKKDR